MKRIKVLTPVIKDPEIAPKRAIIGAFDRLRKNIAHYSPKRPVGEKKELALPWAMVQYTLLASFGSECPAVRAQSGKTGKHDFISIYISSFPLTQSCVVVLIVHPNPMWQKMIGVSETLVQM
jgi:hypothetical protein